MKKLFYSVVIMSVVLLALFSISRLSTAQIKNELGTESDSRENQTKINLNVEELSLTKWDSLEGILYKQVPGANLGATSFEVMDDNRIAFLCNSTSEIIVVDKASGKAIKKFNVPSAPRDFSYSGGYFFVLTESQVIQYDETGNGVNTFSIPNSYVGVERLARFNNSTYLLLASGNSLMIESNGHSIESREREGWITGSGHFVETRLSGNNSYSIKVTTGDDKSYEKVFISDKKVAGVYVVGSTNSRVVLDVQTFISENPISVERTLVVVELNSDGLGSVVANTKVPDSYYVLSNKDFSLIEDGTIFNMVTSPQGVFVFSIAETMSETVHGYPHPIAQTKYHFNDHLVQVDNHGNAETAVSIPESPQITRDQIISNAIPYTTLTWTATSSNIQSTCATISGQYYRTPTWVTVGSKTSVPYKWGGFTHVNSFASLAAQGKKAGNYATTDTQNSPCPQPPYANDSDTEIIGVDCSGFVSRAWGTSIKYGTSNLDTISTQINYSQLQPGDIVNKAGSHTRLIKTYFPQNGSAEVIEASARDWRTSSFTYTPIQQTGYVPLVYNNVSGGGTPGSFTLTLTPECNGTTSQIRLNWTNSSNATSYDIYRNGSLYASGITGLQYINSGNITVGTSYSYYVQARNTSGSTNSNTQSATAPNCASTPANNNFLSAQVITGTGGTVSGTNVGATKEAGEPNHAGNAGGASVWYRWQAPNNGTATITTTGSSFDTLLGVYTGSSVSSLTTIASNDDDPNGGLQSRVVFVAVSGTVYYIAVDGFNAATGSIVLNWSLPVQNYTISVSASPSAGGTVSGGGTFPAGSSRTVTATANSGYTFANWTENGGVVSSSSSYTFTLNGNRTLVANFTLNPVNYTITVSASPSAGGTVSGGGTFPAGSSRTVTAMANSGYNFANWTENGSIVSSASSYNFTLNSNRTLVANFTTNGSQASYDAGLKAPKCGQPGSTCDSGALLAGRDSLSTGSEPNQPNTINNSCADGTTGTYHVDESIDAIKLSTLDGTGFDPGKVVRIDVTLWAWTDPTQDHLDLYYAADANNPNWTYITTLEPSNSGAQVLSTTYTLPSGGSLHAVRARFRYQGSASPCGNGTGYDDYDDLIFAASTVPPSGRTRFDYDGDGKADVSVFRPTNGTWYFTNSSNGAFNSVQFGVNGDRIAPADFEGDGKADISVFRPSSGTWYRLNSSNNLFFSIQFGQSGDIPVPGDFDGDQKADISVFRPANGTWYRLNSSNGQFVSVQFGANGDKPQVGDFDGDGKSDFAVFRPSTSVWHILRSSDGSYSGTAFGQPGDIPNPADFDGDNKADISVFRPSNGTWYRLNSSNGQFVPTQFGTNGDVPSAGDFDGDGKADIAVFRPSNGYWYLLRSTAGFASQQFGANGDVSTPSAFGQ